MDQYKKWLALNVITEERIINYRQLSRALKVHTHLAKQMLYDFHHVQNAKRPQSIHATYLITGTARTGPAPSSNGTTQPDGDSFMQSSPFPSSIPEPDTDFEVDPHENPVKEDVPTVTILLVQEEQLEDAKEEFDEIISVFVYSLEPSPIKDTQLLTTCNREIVTQFSNEDPLESYKKYGIPHNPNVKRRTNKRPVPTVAPPISKVAPKTVAKPIPPAKEVAPPAPKLSRSISDQAKPQKSAPESKTSAPSLQREKSDLFKSFAKTKPPKPKPISRPMSEDEADDEDIVMVEETEEQKQKAEASRKARKEREEELKRMMDEDDDEVMADAPIVDEAVEEGSPIDEKPKEEEPKESVTVQGGRRRGRRRVMKKRTMKDDEGYLVTKEEAVWESFSEEEPELKKKKTNPAPTTAKGKKPAGKPGQGSIMSFFGKK